MLSEGWTETTISNPDASQTRVYRKSAGDLLLTLDANTIDRTYAVEYRAEVLHGEWNLFLDLKRRHA